jgi:hypothetical protein
MGEALVNVPINLQTLSGLTILQLVRVRYLILRLFQVA